MTTPEAIPTVRPVEDFPAGSMHGDAFLYPGVRPEYSFVTNGQSVQPLEWQTDGPDFSFMTDNGETVTPLDEYLEQHNADPMGSRIPVVAYGANMCPGALASKFDKAGDERSDLLVVPTIYGQLKGHDVVWSGGPGIRGNFLAHLHAGEEVDETSVQVGLNFLTREQLLILHSTELDYELSPAEVQLGGQAVQAYFYSGQRSVYLRDGLPVAVANVPADNRQLPEATAKDLLQEVLNIDDVAGMLRQAYADRLEGDEELDADGYVRLIRGLRISAEDKQPRGRLKQRMADALRQLGLVATVDSAADTVHVSWANPSVLPSFEESRRGSISHEVYRLPEMELPRDKWPRTDTVDQDARSIILSSVARHYHRQLGIRASHAS